MMENLASGDSHAVLWLFPTGSPEKSDMVKTDKQGNVADIEIKPRQTELDLTWILAVWKPSFSRYLLSKLRVDPVPIDEPDVLPNADHLGQVFKAAINDGMQIGAVSFEHGASLDIGTPDDLALAQSWTA
jgi:NDP-sugar pyrophosphorylase family protein